MESTDAPFGEASRSWRHAPAGAAESSGSDASRLRKELDDERQVQTCVFGTLPALVENALIAMSKTVSARRRKGSLLVRALTDVKAKASREVGRAREGQARAVAGAGTRSSPSSCRAADASSRSVRRRVATLLLSGALELAGPPPQNARGSFKSTRDYGGSSSRRKGPFSTSRTPTK